MRYWQKAPHSAPSRVIYGVYFVSWRSPDSKVHGANIGPIWGRQDPGGPHVGLMNLAIWVWYISLMIMATEGSALWNSS